MRTWIVFIALIVALGIYYIGAIQRLRPTFDLTGLGNLTPTGTGLAFSIYTTIKIPNPYPLIFIPIQGLQYAIYTNGYLLLSTDTTQPNSYTIRPLQDNIFRLATQVRIDQNTAPILAKKIAGEQIVGEYRVNFRVFGFLVSLEGKTII